MEDFRPSRPRQLSRTEIFFVLVGGYIYLVPCVAGKGMTFLKTIIPSRKATKAYKEEKEREHEI